MKTWKVIAYDTNGTFQVFDAESNQPLAATITHAEMIQAVPELITALIQLRDATLNHQTTREIREAIKASTVALDKAHGAS